MRLRNALALLPLAVGCGYGPCQHATENVREIADLHVVMTRAGFVPMQPPQAGLEPGTVVAIEGGVPRVLATPSAAELNSSPIVSEHDTPAVERDFTVQTGLAVGVSLPGDVTARLSASGVRSYSLAARKGAIHRIQIDPWRVDFLPKMAGRFGVNTDWAGLRDRSLLFLVYELWTAQELEYRFFDASGATVNLRALQLPLELEGGFEVSESGSIVYRGKPLCLGYRAIPIEQLAWEIVFPAGKYAVQSMQQVVLRGSAGKKLSCQSSGTWLCPESDALNWTYAFSLYADDVEVTFREFIDAQRRQTVDGSRSFTTTVGDSGIVRLSLKAHGDQFLHGPSGHTRPCGVGFEKFMVVVRED